MTLEDFSNKIERSDFYKFMNRHKRVINVVEGFFIIGLLIAINIYVYKDHFIKKQIAENCGYETSRYECICDKKIVEEWKDEQKGGYKLNLTIENGTDKLDG